MRPTCIRFDTNLIETLKRIARARAYNENRNVTWVSVLDEAARRLVRAEGETVKEPKSE
jgi:hypothetical protein